MLPNNPTFAFKFVTLCSGSCEKMCAKKDFHPSHDGNGSKEQRNAGQCQGQVNDRVKGKSMTGSRASPRQ